LRRVKDSKILASRVLARERDSEGGVRVLINEYSIIDIIVIKS
jgi:hypothetical protein